MKKIPIAAGGLAALIVAFAFMVLYLLFNPGGDSVSNFDECVAAGNPIIETYPEQCITKDGTSYTRAIVPGETVTKLPSY